ncbi:hypothetical protein CVT24_008813 [Panaeolus cyanescens]|uniref:Retrotransposon gag domain-containing protein n=1 Tax=Panaeolus cyanescens TaxID=181874 RepID=A0A409WRK4_9AGAR|nr:hypothetical protein CVT24_008813 [Panaeolus cyanescens]
MAPRTRTMPLDTNSPSPISSNNLSTSENISSSLHDAMGESLSHSPAAGSNPAEDILQDAVDPLLDDRANWDLLDQQLAVTRSMKILMNELRNTVDEYRIAGLPVSNSIVEKMKAFSKEFEKLEGLPLPGHTRPYNEMVNHQEEPNTVTTPHNVPPHIANNGPVVQLPEQNTTFNDRRLKDTKEWERMRAENEMWRRAEGIAKAAEQIRLEKEFEARTGERYHNKELLRDSPPPQHNCWYHPRNTTTATLPTTPATNIPARVISHIPNPNALPTPVLPFVNDDEPVTINKSLLHQIQLVLAQNNMTTPSFSSSDDKGGKAGNPDPYNGQPDDVIRFLLDLENCFTCSPSAFRSDKKKIQFALSYCKEGTPKDWKTQCLWDMATGSFPHTTWNDFRVYFINTWGDDEPEHVARRKLYALRQGSKVAKAFFIEVEIGMRASKITDTKQIIVHVLDHMLHKTLREEVLRQGANFNDFDAFRERVVSIDANLRHFNPNYLETSKRSFNKSTSPTPVALSSNSSTELSVCSFCKLKGHVVDNCYKKARLEAAKAKSERLRVVCEMTENLEEEDKEFYFQFLTSSAEDFSTAED